MELGTACRGQVDQTSAGNCSGVATGSRSPTSCSAVQYLKVFSYSEHMRGMNEAVDTQYIRLLGDMGIHTLLLPGGLPAEGWADALLTRGHSQQEYSFFVRANFTLADAAWIAAEQSPTLVLTGFVSPRTADALRRAKIQYLDTAGNAWIEFGDVLIDVRGRPRPKDAKSVSATGNLFSTARAQVIFALLAWPELWKAPHRDVARAAEVSVGQAHNARQLLSEAGYIRGPRPPGQPDLLDLWTAAYPTGLAAKLTRATYNGPIDHVKPARHDSSLYVSGESAATDMLLPATLTLYAPEFDPRLAVVNRWRSDGPANIEVRHAFWRAPQGDTPGVHIAPWPLVYADLSMSDDSRVRQAAQWWKESNAGSDSSS